MDTSGSLLQRLANVEPQAWNEFVALYAPLLRSWLQRYDLQDCDAEDLAQETLLALTADIHRFQHSGRTGAFRAWLKTILVNRLRAFWRKRRNTPSAPATSDFWDRLDELEDDNSALSRHWNQEHDRQVLERLLKRVAGRFEGQTFDVFRRYVLENTEATQVAAEMKLSLNAVFIAKSRVLRALRQEVAATFGSEQEFDVH